jgi:hypothetical protein
MGKAHRRLGFVLVLTTWSPGSIRLNNDLSFEDLRIDIEASMNLFHTPRLPRDGLFSLFFLFFFIRAMLDDQGVHHEDDILGDIRRMVGNSFEASADDHEMDSTGDRFWIRKHEGEEFSKDLTVEPIDHIVLFTYRASQFGIAVHKGIENVLHH